MVRLARQWNQRAAPRPAGQTASALSVVVYRLAGQALLALENEGFDTDDWSMRLDVIEQFAIFGAHLIDRAARERLSEASRAELLGALARHLAALVQDNREESDGPGEHAARFLDRLNERGERYADCEWSAQEGPGFALRRELGDAVAARMAETGRQWISMYVIDREAPRFATALERSLRGLLPASGA